MLVTLIPLFDEEMRVRAYSIFSQKKNYLLEPMYLNNADYIDGVNIQGLEIINKIGLETLVADSEIFVPVTEISIFSDINSQCQVPHDRVVLLMDNKIKPESSYINRIRQLKADGYKLAIRKLNVPDFEPYKEILKLMDYCILNHQKVVISKARIYFKVQYPNVSLVAGNLQSFEIFEELRSEGGYHYYEGDFYRMPVDRGNTEIAPLKINYIELMNIVNDSNFDLTKAADVIGRDAALVISLLEIVNKMAVNSEITSIRHAAAMLGQVELRKWINTAITRQLCADKPSEISRLSLLRAKFAENLSNYFGLAANAQELFLMGLYSVIDLILGVPMKEALEKMNIAKNIKTALVDKTGPYVAVMEFIRSYENADWQEVSRIMVLDNISMEDVNTAYMSTLEWYRNLFRN